MNVTLASGRSVRVATLIPSKGRSVPLMDGLRKRPWLVDEDLFIAVEPQQWPLYEPIFRRYPQIQLVVVDNPYGSTGVCRDTLREAACRGRYDYYVSTDDNAQFDEQGFVNLVRCAAEWPEQPCVATGYHEYMEFKNRGAVLTDVQVHNGIRSYEGISFPHTCIPHELYAPFRYPPDVAIYEDVYFAMWSIRHGCFDWRICMDARYAKRRFEPGGLGSQVERVEKAAMGLSRVCADFPEMAGSIRTTIPWSTILTSIRREYR